MHSNSSCNTLQWIILTGVVRDSDRPDSFVALNISIGNYMNEGAL